MDTNPDDICLIRTNYYSEKSYIEDLLISKGIYWMWTRYTMVVII